MPTENKYLLEEFEKEVWLYIDKDLPEGRIKFWDNQIKKNPELKNIYDSVHSTLKEYDQIAEESISDFQFNKMIENVISINNKSLVHKIIEALDNLEFGGLNFRKIAIGGALALAAFIILLISEKPNPISEVSADLLEWDAPQLVSRIEKTTYEFAFIKDNELEDYLMESIQNDPWKKSFYDIKQSIDKIESDIKQEQL